jgi:hypothetical protein
MTDTTSEATAASEPKKKAPEDTAVELEFTGNPRVGVAGVPAADLTRAEIDRITYRRTIPEPGTRGLSRGQKGFSEARAKVVRDLVGTGKFEKRGN